MVDIYSLLTLLFSVLIVYSWFTKLSFKAHTIFIVLALACAILSVCLDKAFGAAIYTGLFAFAICEIKDYDQED